MGWEGRGQWPFDDLVGRKGFMEMRYYRLGVGWVAGDG